MKYYIRKGLNLLMAILCVGWVQAQTTIYVSPEGEDSNNGQSAESAKTLTGAVSSAQNGDIIILAPGTYADTYSINKAITIKGGDTKASKESTEEQNAVVTGRFQLATTGSYTIENIKFVRESSSSVGAGTASVEMNTNNVTLAINNCCFINDKGGTANSGAGSSMCVISGSSTSGCALTIKNTEMYLNGKYQRGFSDRSSSFTSFRMEDSKILSDNLSANIYNRPIAIYSGSCAVKNSAIEVGHGYCITVAGSNMTCSVEDSELKGFGTLYIFYENNQITISNSVLTGVAHSGVSNYFGTITFENAYTNKLSVTNSVISNFYGDKVEGREHLIYFNGWSIDGPDATSKKNTVVLTNTRVRTTNLMVPTYVWYYPSTTENTVELSGDGNIFSYNLKSNPITKENQEIVLASDELAIVIKDSEGNFINATATLPQAIAAAHENQTIVVPAGTYELSSQLVIDKPITLQGAEDGKTIIKAGDNGWSVADNLKNLVSIEGGQVRQTVTLQDLTIANSQRSGLNVQTEMNTVLKNVKLADNTGAGMIVHSPVTANGLITEGNGWGGVNVDQGTPTYDILMHVGTDCAFSEIYPIYSDVPANTENAVTFDESVKADWFTGVYGIYDKNHNVVQRRIWSDGMILDMASDRFNVFGNGKAITISESGNNTVIQKGTGEMAQTITLPNTSKIAVYAGARGAAVESTQVTMTGGKLWNLYGGGYGEDGPANVGTATVQVNGGTIDNVLVGGGYQQAKTTTVALTVEGNETNKPSINYLLVGGFGSPAAPAIVYNWDEVVCGANEANVTVKQATVTNMGGGGGQGYTFTGTTTLQAEDSEIYEFCGTQSNGYAANETATFTRCKFTNNMATINRGQVGVGKFTFDNCTFTNSPTLGATTGWANTDTKGTDLPKVNGSVEYVFTNMTTVPTVLVGEGLENANVTLQGAPAQIAKFERITTDKTLQNFDKTLSAFAINSNKTWSFDSGLTMEEGTTLTIKDNAKLITPETTALAEVTIEKDAQIANGELTANKLRTTVTLTDKKWKAYGFPAAFQLVSKDEKKTTYDKPSEQDAETGAWIAGLSANKLPFTYNTAFDEQGGLLAATDGDYYVESTEKVTLKETKPTTPAAGTFQLFANPTLADMELSGVYFYTLDATNNQFLPYDSTEPYILQPFETVLLTDAETFQTLRSVGIGEGGATANEWIAKEGYYLTTERGAIVVHTAEPMELYVVAVSGAVVYRGTVTDGERIAVPTGFYAVNGQIVRVK